MRTQPTRSPLPALWCVIISSLLIAVPASAAPLMGRVVPIRQSDGLYVEAVVWGDEYYAVGETRDGYTLTPDPATGFLCYARLSEDGRALVSTGVRAHETPPPELARHVRIDPAAAHERALASRADIERRALDRLPEPGVRGGRGPTTGQVRGIVLLIDFSDDHWSIPPGTVADYCNLPGYTGYGNNGSVRDYFYDVSEGALEYTNYVPTAYYRAGHSKNFYCDPSIPAFQRAGELIQEALTALNASGFDFSEYDSDDNGIIDAVNCFYAGDIWNNWAEGLWPHQSWVSFCADGVCTDRYQMSDMGSYLMLGTFCHENGHMLMSWPDLYDYGGESAGVGNYCLMAYGGDYMNPVEPCPYLKIHAGWADPIVVTDSAEDLQASYEGNVVYKLGHPSLWNEYYLVENRQQVGRDASLPDNGLAIWHIDALGSNDFESQSPLRHYLVTVVQADGLWDLEHFANVGDGMDLYAAPVYTECTPATYPSTDWWSRSESGHAITNISISGATMTFDYADMPPSRPAQFAVEADELCAMLEWSRVNVDDFGHYLVERDTTAQFGSATVAVQTPDTTHVAYPLEPGTEYFFRVFVVDAEGRAGPPTDTLSAIPTSDVPPPAATGLAALAGGGVVELRWDAPELPDVLGYHVVRDSTTAFATPETLAFPLDGPYMDATCPLNQARWYRLVAEDHGGVLSGPTAPVAGIAVSGRAWYADASYGGLEFGSYPQPYRSISTAVGRAASGDVVIIQPGDYAEAVAVKNGVSMVGTRGASSTTVNGAMTAFGAGRSTVLKGLRLDGGGALTIDLDCFLSDIVIEDCEFMGATTAGVSCHDGGSPLIRRNLFTANLRGIRCVDSGPLVVSNTFVANTSSDIANFGNPGPVIGGSLAAANDFLEPGTRAIANYDSVVVSAEYNHWGDDCVDPAWFSGSVDYLPWTDETHTLTFTECWTSVSEGAVPTVAYLKPGAPNPMSHATAIAFGLPEPLDAVTLRVYSVSGRVVRTLVDTAMAAGHHVAWWDGRDEHGVGVASGVYLYRLEGGATRLLGKVAVLR